MRDGRASSSPADVYEGDSIPLPVSWSIPRVAFESTDHPPLQGTGGAKWLERKFGRSWEGGSGAPADR
jgi:hypothetical protein